jgi:hypothetical protein
MRYSSVFVVAFVFAIVPAFASADAPLTPRPVDPLAADTFARARRDSAIVRGLVATLESSNVIVHIESSRTMPAGICGMTRFVISRGGFRYLRITIGADLSSNSRTAILAHELQHAYEVAASPADDLESVRQLFTDAGQRDGEFFETLAALDTEKRVRLELREKNFPARRALPGK